MFKVSEDQLSRLSRTREDEFLDRMTDVLKVDFSSSITVEERDPFARKAIAHGRQLGFMLSEDSESWLRLNAAFGAGFPSLPWVTRILSDRVLNAREQMHLLKRRAVFASRQTSETSIPELVA